jgi:hypothetical protein
MADCPVAPRSPWQNAYVERVIGSIRRDCLDHVVVLSERQLRAIVRHYVEYYNCARTHLSLAKDAPWPGAWPDRRKGRSWRFRGSAAYTTNISDSLHEFAAIEYSEGTPGQN